MKQKETEFLKALGGIPQSYIDELTQFQAEHAQTPGMVRRKPKQRSDEQRKENLIMMHATQRAADNIKEHDISVRKLKPMTIGILASLTACAVLAVGFCISHFRNVDLAMTPATAPEQSEIPVIEETEPVSEENPGADPSAGIIGLCRSFMGFRGDNTETGGIPEIPDNSAMLFTSMDAVRPLLERLTASDLSSIGMENAESCFGNGQNLLIIKTGDAPHIKDIGVRSLYLTADGYLHVDATCYCVTDRDSQEPIGDPQHSQFYQLLSVPGSLNEISGLSVQYSRFISDDVSEKYDPFREEMKEHDATDQLYLKQLAYNEADYIFPDTTYELYAPDADMDEDSAWMLGSMLLQMNGAGLPEQLTDHVLKILTDSAETNQNALVGLNNVQSGAAPYISVYETADGTARRLVYPEQKYNAVLDGGTRITILVSDALSEYAEMQAPIEATDKIESALPHTNGHASFLTIVNNP